MGSAARQLGGLLAARHWYFLMARSGVSNCQNECPMLGGGLNRSTQHFIVEGKIDCRPISQRFRDGEKAAKKMSLWDSWLRWDSLKAIGRVFGKPSSLFIAA